MKNNFVLESFRELCDGGKIIKFKRSDGNFFIGEDKELAYYVELNLSTGQIRTISANNLVKSKWLSRIYTYDEAVSLWQQFD